MEQTLKITLIQTDNFWEDIDKNLRKLSSKVAEIKEDTDMIVLPELFSTGFTMEAKQVAESMEGEGVAWMLKLAQQKSCLVMGSLLIVEDGYYYNRMIVAFPDNKFKYYDKRHLFSFAGEDKVFKAGNDRLIFEYKGFRICPLICYDLRFPVWARNTEDIDLMVFVANWPNARMLAWDTLLRARSIENLCYVVGLNRIGIDNNQLEYTGHSGVFDAMGDKILHLEPAKEMLDSVTLYKSNIDEVRSKFRFLEDRDTFKIN